MTGSEEDSKLKVIIKPNHKVKQFSSSSNNNNDLQNQYNSKTSSGKSRHYRDGIQHQTEEKVNEILGNVEHRTSTNSSPRSDIRSRGSSDQRGSRSSSVDGDLENSRNKVLSRKVVLDGNINIEIDKSVTSSSVVYDGEHAKGLNDEDLEVISKVELIALYHRLQDYIEDLQRKHQDDLRQAKEVEGKLRADRAELSRREKVLMMRLTTRERQLVESGKEITVLKSSIVPSLGALRSTLLDPAVNLVIQKLKKDLAETKKKLEDTQNDLNAWKFTPDSNTGKRLMAKCRMLYLENEDLGKQTSSGRIAKLENDLALNKELVVEMKQSQAEMDEVVQELDEDIEGLQSAIQHLQQKLRSANERNAGTSDVFPLPSSFKTELASSNSGEPSLSVHCAQCSFTNATSKPGMKELIPEPTAIRTRVTLPISGGDDDRTAIEFPNIFGRVEIDKRTSLVNGELENWDKNPSPLNYLQSVQRVKNPSRSNSPGIPPPKKDYDNKSDSDSCDVEILSSRSKRAKLTAGSQDEGKATSMPQSFHPTSLNGNGSIEY